MMKYPLQLLCQNQNFHGTLFIHRDNRVRWKTVNTFMFGTKAEHPVPVVVQASADATSELPVKSCQNHTMCYHAATDQSIIRVSEVQFMLLSADKCHYRERNMPVNAGENSYKIGTGFKPSRNNFLLWRAKMKQKFELQGLSTCLDFQFTSPHFCVLFIVIYKFQKLGYKRFFMSNLEDFSCVIFTLRWRSNLTLQSN